MHSLPNTSQIPTLKETMLMLNRVTLIGRLTDTPELRYTPNGNAVTDFSLAVNRSYANSDGEREADFFQCVAWRGLAETICQYKKKGEMIAVDGRLEQQKWENEEGQKRSKVVIVAENIQFIGAKKEEDKGKSDLPF